MHRATARAIWACVGLTAIAAAAESPSSQSLTAEQDHRRLLDLLKIQELRRGPDGDPNSPRAANFDESKVNQNIELPALLKLSSGQSVKSADQWWKQRRPELVELFDREIYGRLPKHTPKVTWELASQATELSGTVPTTRKKLIGHADNKAFPSITV